jgi:hypothetical protein
MGGTGSKSSTTSDTLTDLSIKAIQSSISKCITTATQSQLLSIKSVKGNVTVTGTSLSQGSSVKMDCLLTSDSQSDIQASISNAIVQWAKSQSEALLGVLGKSEAEAVSNVKNKLAVSISQTTLQEALSLASQKQAVEIGDVEGNVVISGLTMTQTLEMVASTIIKGTAYSTVISDIATSMDQSSESTQTNPIAEVIDSVGSIVSTALSSWMIIVAVIVICGALISVVFIKTFFSSSSSSPSPFMTYSSMIGLRPAGQGMGQMGL